ncbi:MAG: pentapeptide repeat-containing protein [Magnetococcales bacterium]|nr:pentapeptide repeat-containing protein [Magnetococcales bacterium]
MREIVIKVVDAIKRSTSRIINHPLLAMPPSQPRFIAAWGIVSVVLYWIFSPITRAASGTWEDLRNVGLILVGWVGVPLLYWRTLSANHSAEAALRATENSSEQIRVAVKGQVSDRFSKAADLLGKEGLATRMAGVYALEQIAKEAPDEYYVPVMRTLCAFVRDRANKDKDGKPLFRPVMLDYQDDDNDHQWSLFLDEAAFFHLPSDLAAIFEVIHRRDLEKENALKEKMAGEMICSLARADMIKLDLNLVDFRGLNLHSTDFQGANLSKANLQGANLSEANLLGANFSEANLQDVDLTEASGLTLYQLLQAKNVDWTRVPEDIQKKKAAHDAAHAETNAGLAP